jgi:hypothetical protein
VSAAADLIAPSAHALRPQRTAVELERSRVGGDQTHQNIGDGTFAGSRRPHQGDDVPRWDYQAQVGHRRDAFFAVDKRYVVGREFPRERQPPMRMRGRLGVNSYLPTGGAAEPAGAPPSRLLSGTRVCSPATRLREVRSTSLESQQRIVSRRMRRPKVVFEIANWVCFYRVIQTAAEENWVCYVRAKFAAEVGAATVSKHRERHRRSRRRLSGLDSFGHEDRGERRSGRVASIVP